MDPLLQRSWYLACNLVVRCPTLRSFFKTCPVDLVFGSQQGVWLPSQQPFIYHLKCEKWPFATKKNSENCCLESKRETLKYGVLIYLPPCTCCVYGLIHTHTYSSGSRPPPYISEYVENGHIFPVGPKYGLLHVFWSCSLSQEKMLRFYSQNILKLLIYIWYICIYIMPG